MVWGLSDDRCRWTRDGEADAVWSSSGRRPLSGRLRPTPAARPRQPPAEVALASGAHCCPVTVAWVYFSFRMLFTDPFTLTFSLASYYNYGLKKLLFSGKRMF